MYKREISAIVILDMGFPTIFFRECQYLDNIIVAKGYCSLLFDIGSLLIVLEVNVTSFTTLQFQQSLIQCCLNLCEAKDFQGNNRFVQDSAVCLNLIHNDFKFNTSCDYIMIFIYLFSFKLLFYHELTSRCVIANVHGHYSLFAVFIITLQRALFPQQWKGLLVHTLFQRTSPGIHVLLSLVCRLV